MTQFFSVKVGSLLAAVVVSVGLPLASSLLSNTPANAAAPACVAQAEINDSADTAGVVVHLNASRSCSEAPLRVYGMTSDGQPVLITTTPMPANADGSHTASVAVNEDPRFDYYQVTAGDFFSTELTF